MDGLDGILFDMDGVLVNSIASDERKWRDWALAKDLDPDEVLRTVHGLPNRDIVPLLRPDLDAGCEVALVEQYEIDHSHEVLAIPGSPEFVAQVPSGRWAVFTSAARPVAEARLRAAGYGEVPVLVTPEDVSNGKPAPDGYLLAAQLLGLDIARCLVIEDSPTGVAAGRSAGARVLGLLTSHLRTALAEADLWRDSLAGVELLSQPDGRLRIEL